jgi:hypothetical protein
MTSQELATLEEHRENRPSMADLATANAAPHPSLTMAKPAQEPNLPLLAQNDLQDLHSRWEKIQIGFVDEPRTAVVQADELVASSIKRLADVFAAERHKLEAEWDKADKVSTEDLRVALRRYRSFFDRLLSV